MDGCESFDHLADDLTLWQAAAQQLPLADVRVVLDASLCSLAHALNAFNDIDRSDDGPGVPADVLAHAIGVVTRQATVAAIFTLGAAQRTREVAQQN
jgi:hypothetical protein